MCLAQCEACRLTGARTRRPRDQIPTVHSGHIGNTLGLTSQSRSLTWRTTYPHHRPAGTVNMTSVHLPASPI
jgi:hypothetical protein